MSKPLPRLSFPCGARKKRHGWTDGGRKCVRACDEIIIIVCACESPSTGLCATEISAASNSTDVNRVRRGMMGVALRTQSRERRQATGRQRSRHGGRPNETKTTLRSTKAKHAPAWSGWTTDTTRKSTKHPQTRREEATTHACT